MLFGLTSVAVLALLPLVARHLVQGGPLVYGVLLGAFGVGAIGGAFLAGRLRARAFERGDRPGRLRSLRRLRGHRRAEPERLADRLGMLAGGAAWVLALSLFNVTVQLSTPRWVVGRALALYQTAAFGGMALGSWLWGSVAEAHGLVARAPRRRGRDARRRARSGSCCRCRRAPSSTSTRSTSGRSRRSASTSSRGAARSPISIEYLIDEPDVREFLDGMAERHRIRLRDGARQWTLMRDLEDPRLWIESYQTPTWVDYIRHNMRRTKADAASTERIRALHRGPDLPRVHRRILRPTRWFSEPAARAPIDQA